MYLTELKEVKVEVAVEKLKDRTIIKEKRVIHKDGTITEEKEIKNDISKEKETESSSRTVLKEEIVKVEKEATVEKLGYQYSLGVYTNHSRELQVSVGRSLINSLWLTTSVTLDDYSKPSLSSVGYLIGLELHF